MSSKVLHCPWFGSEGQLTSESKSFGVDFTKPVGRGTLWTIPDSPAVTSKHTSHTLLEIVLKDLRQLAFVPLSVWKFSQLKSLSLWFIKSARIFLQSTSCSGKTVKGLFRHERGSEGSTSCPALIRCRDSGVARKSKRAGVWRASASPLYKNQVSSCMSLAFAPFSCTADPGPRRLNISIA
jgi:hypothetical protein